MKQVERCPKCNALLDEGFLVDFSHNGVRVAQWAEGPPSYGFLRLLRLRGRRRLAVEAARCPKCGLLQLWAPEPRR